MSRQGRFEIPPQIRDAKIIGYHELAIALSSHQVVPCTDGKPLSLRVPALPEQPTSRITKENRLRIHGDL